MKYSTGRSGRVKHSIGIDPARLEKIKRRVRSIKHSTGGKSSLAHYTGKETDYKVLYDQVIEEEEKEIKEEKDKIEKNKGK